MRSIKQALRRLIHGREYVADIDRFASCAGTTTPYASSARLRLPVYDDVTRRAVAEGRTVSRGSDFRLSDADRARFDEIAAPLAWDLDVERALQIVTEEEGR